MNIICYYILSAITGFNAFMQIRLVTKIDTGPLLALENFYSLR